MEINICRKKQLTNTRSSGADESPKLVPVKQMTLEQCLEFISIDELVEITPLNIRMRKRLLDSGQRKRASSKSNK